ncbi:MAG: hypothetical protein R3F62_00115 [Planctomycetota bacterium]
MEVPPNDTPARLERARELTAELKTLAQRWRQHEAQIAERLAVVKRERLYEDLGYASLAAYARGEGLFKSRSKVCQLVQIIEGSEELPCSAPPTSRARSAGKARELVKLARPETEAEWLAAKDDFTSSELAAIAAGKPPARRRTLSLTAQASAEFDQLVAALRQESPEPLTDGDAVLELMRRGSSAAPGERPLTRLVISVCPDCDQASTESRDGPVPVPASSVDTVFCNGEVHDLRDEDNHVTRAIPAKVRRRVLDRDRRRCRVPACRSMSGLELHHEDGWKKGHDPKRIVTLCWNHHVGRHEGKLRIVATGKGRFRFFLADGTELVERNPAVGAFPHENGSAFPHEHGSAFPHGNGSTSPHGNGSTSPHGNGSAFPRGNGQGDEGEQGKAPEEVALATQGLIKLGLGKREATRRIRVALQDGARNASELVGAALRQASELLPGVAQAWSVPSLARARRGG